MPPPSGIINTFLSTLGILSSLIFIFFDDASMSIVPVINIPRNLLQNSRQVILSPHSNPLPLLPSLRLSFTKIVLPIFDTVTPLTDIFDLSMGYLIDWLQEIWLLFYFGGVVLH